MESPQTLQEVLTINQDDELIVTNPAATDEKPSKKVKVSNFHKSAPDASQSQRGYVTTSAQEFAGKKTFNGGIKTDSIDTEAGLAVTGNTSVTGTFAASGNTSSGGNHTVTGKVTAGAGAEVTGDVDITGDETINGDLNINGNIYQRGSSYETHAEDFYTKKDMVHLREGAQFPLGNGELAGVSADHYDTDGNNGVLGFDKTGEARVGDKGERAVIVYSSDGTTFYTDSELTEAATIPAGVTPEATGETNEYSYQASFDDTEPLLTREEISDLQNMDLLAWDNTAKKAVHIPRPAQGMLTLQSRINSGVLSYAWGEASNMAGVAFMGTRAQYEVAKLITRGNPGFIPSGSLVIITDENDMLKGVEA